MRRRASVQTVHVAVEAVEDGVLRLTDGGSRAVLEVGSVAFDMAGDVEREALVAAYARWLNSLTFPVQILVRVLPVDLDGYLAVTEARAQQLAEPLAALAHDHAAFLRRLARHRTLLERRFYVVVPAEGETRRRGLWRSKRPVPTPDGDAVRRQLTTRCDEVARGLGRCGLTARRLDDVELAQLLYACWCPDLARVQRLRRHLSDYTAWVVHAAAHARSLECPS